MARVAAIVAAIAAMTMARVAGCAAPMTAPMRADVAVAPVTEAEATAALAAADVSVATERTEATTATARAGPQHAGDGATQIGTVQLGGDGWAAAAILIGAAAAGGLWWRWRVAVADRRSLVAMIREHETVGVGHVRKLSLRAAAAEAGVGEHLARRVRQVKAAWTPGPPPAGQGR